MLLKTPRCPSTQKPWTFQLPSSRQPPQQHRFLWRFPEIAGPSDNTLCPPGQTEWRPGTCVPLDWGLQLVMQIESVHSLAVTMRTFEEQSWAQHNTGLHACSGTWHGSSLLNWETHLACKEICIISIIFMYIHIIVKPMIRVNYRLKMFSYCREILHSKAY